MVSTTIQDAAAEPERHAAHDSHLDHAAEAARIISSAAKWSAAAGVIPLPFIDLVALAAVQTRMLSDLSKLYTHDFGSEIAHSVVSVLLGTLVPGVVTGGLVGSSIKFAPVTGSIAGGISMALFGAAATYAIGKVFVSHLNGGGTPFSFNAKAVEQDLKAEFSKAKGK
jgi:uncharacterized protein (DUF697 family)